MYTQCPECGTAFRVTAEVLRQAAGKVRCDVRVDMPAWEEHWNLTTDEGAFHGGEASAPPPLALFAAGFAGCIMIQIRALSKRLKNPVDKVRIAMKCHWKGERQVDKTWHGLPVGFDCVLNAVVGQQSYGPAKRHDRAALAL